MAIRKLTENEKHFLRLAKKGEDDKGWAKVSRFVWPIQDHIPEELLERRIDGDGERYVKLTDGGRAIATYI